MPKYQVMHKKPKTWVRHYEIRSRPEVVLFSGNKTKYHKADSIPTTQRDVIRLSVTPFAFGIIKQLLQSPCDPTASQPCSIDRIPEAF